MIVLGSFFKTQFNPLSFKYFINYFYYKDQNNGWTLNNDKLDFLLFYLDGLHSVEKGNFELRKSILKAINSTIIGSKIPNCYKNAVCSIDFSLNLKDFPTLSCIAPVRDSIFCCKSIINVACISSIRLGKFICDSNVPPSKPNTASVVCTSKPICDRNVHLSKLSVLFC